jgi:hypothetical protein
MGKASPRKGESLTPAKPDRLEPRARGYALGAAQTRRGLIKSVVTRRARRGRRRYALARPVGQSEERHRTGRDVAWRSRVFAVMGKASPATLPSKTLGTEPGSD